MKTRCLFVLVVLLSLHAAAQTKSDPVLARGKYLVEKAGQCQDCHSARGPDGQYIGASWLKGAPLPFKPTITIPNWTEFALPIAGLPGITEEDAVQLLVTGKDKSGNTRRPPMPQYRFSRTDATAIVKYLKSLGTSTAAGKLAKQSQTAKNLRTKRADE
jgi:mono/diheme cytochrome c family protein